MSAGTSWNAALSYGLQQYMLRREQGRLDEVEELVRRSVEEFPNYPIYRCAGAQMSAELGNTAEASKALEDLADGRFRRAAVRRRLARGNDLARRDRHSSRRCRGRRPYLPAAAAVRRKGCHRHRRGQHRGRCPLPRASGSDQRAPRRRRAPLRAGARPERADRRPTLAGAHSAGLRPDALRAIGPATKSSRSSWPAAPSRAIAAWGWTPTRPRPGGSSARSEQHSPVSHRRVTAA